MGELIQKIVFEFIYDPKVKHQNFEWVNGLGLLNYLIFG